jgi:hypothetical protein
MTKMAVKRTGVVKKHCSAFVLFSKGVYPQTKFISIKVKERKTKGGPTKNKNSKNWENHPITCLFLTYINNLTTTVSHSFINLFADDTKTDA